MHFFSRPETAGLACFRQASRSRWLSSGLLSGMMAEELGGLPSAGGPVRTIAGWALRGGFPPGPGQGIQAFSRESPDARVAGDAPRPPALWPARWHSLVLALGATLFRSMGYYGAHVRALIWDAFSGRAAQPRGFPLGKLSPKVTDEGRSTCPTGQEKIPLGRLARAAQTFYKERLGTGSPLIRPSVRTGAPMVYGGFAWT